MTREELKNKLFSKRDKVSFGITNYEFALSLEDIFIKNGWVWRGRNKGEKILENYFKNQISIFHFIIIHSNYNLYEPKILSWDSRGMNNFDLLIIKETLNEIENILSPKPNYNPRKIIIDI